MCLDFDPEKSEIFDSHASKLTNSHNPSNHFIQCKKVF